MKTQNRRSFVHSLGLLTGAAVLNPNTLFAQKAYTIAEVISIILKNIPEAPFSRTVDKLRTGSMSQNVTGIVTTMFPTMEVIEKAAALGANFIIAHETPFYNNNDETDWLKDDDAYKYKMELIEKHNIAIWRFHDYWHAHKPDGITMGNVIKLGWQDYYNYENKRMLELPEAMSSKAILKLVKKRLGVDNVRFIGDLKQNCSKIYLAFGYHGSTEQIAAIQKYKPDLILSGETREWETVERVRDGRLMGEKTSIMVLSHSVSEEAGMEYAAEWLRPQLQDVRIWHLPSGNPFTFK